MSLVGALNALESQIGIHLREPGYAVRLHSLNLSFKSLSRAELIGAFRSNDRALAGVDPAIGVADHEVSAGPGLDHFGSPNARREPDYCDKSGVSHLSLLDRCMHFPKSSISSQAGPNLSPNFGDARRIPLSDAAI